MTRVAYLVSEYPAASHTFIRREIEALRKLGLTIQPVSVRASQEGNAERVPSILGMPWHRLIWAAGAMLLSRPWRSVRTWILAQTHRPLGVRGWIWAQFHFAEALVLAAMLRAVGAERLHSHFANSGATVGMLAANLLQLPWSLTLHGISETDPPAGALLPDKIKRAQFVACASWFMRAQAMRVVPPELWPKLQVVRCGVDLAQLTPLAPVSPQLPVRFVTVGRISAEKGYPGLLSAFQAVLDAGVDADLTIVGDGPLRDWLRVELDRLALGDRIKLRGALPEAETLDAIARSDVFVLASLMEGLPVVLMEAMGLCKPVIAPCVAGIPELVRDPEGGLLFRPGDWSHLASCMLLVARSPDLRQRLGSRSRCRIEQEFEISVAVRPLVSLLES